jgi:predicted AAA+ superfamily ATPase
MTFFQYGAMLKTMKREIEKQIQKDLDKKIVLLTGPRQVGKTTLSKSFHFSIEYINYDHTDSLKIIMNQNWNRNVDLVIFDEIHKKPKWKSWIKGIYDVEGVRPRLLVTGSARMDTFKKMGDSLAGRHFLFRLHPFTVSELKNQMPKVEILDRLMATSGFPEPFMNGDKAFYKRWQSTHLERILKEDMLELEQVRNLKLMQVLIELLCDRVGSPISMNSLAKDLEISPHTVKKWISILESLYIIFIVTPYSKNIARSILKEPKIYFYDSGKVNDKAAKFENIVALALLKKLHLGQDLKGEKSELHYLRDKEKREVDFLTVIDKKIVDLVEVKMSDDQLSPHLKYSAERLNAQNSVQVVYELKKEKTVKGIHIRQAAEWLSEQ